ncbi:transcription factor bHLH104-like [Populus alba x Populus x berolinensis]|uniref:Transcription factor bHLH104-like n=1 Tax=Populus alba x Populus x berolinensis TaxID=444605 RepID=A0AAD6MAB1_9ROSI|nr:transcription factor bHLH104-like [Populus alba x Populus x berolinensis]
MEAIDQIEGDDSYLDYLDILLGPADSLTNSICSSGGVVDIDFSSSVGVVTQVKECSRKRFQDLSSVLEPGRPAKTDKPAILDDAIRVLNQLKNEAQELKETNEKLLEEIKSLKAEKTELREEKLMLKADKEKMEQQLKTLALPTSGFMPTYPAAYHAAANKIPVFPGYGLMPMWHYLPPAACDTSRDHELRPPAA